MRLLLPVVLVACLIPGSAVAQGAGTGVQLRAVLAPSMSITPESIPLQFELKVGHTEAEVADFSLQIVWNLYPSARRLQATAFFSNPGCALQSSSGTCIVAENIEVSTNSQWAAFSGSAIGLFIEPVSPAHRVGHREDRLRVRIRAGANLPDGLYRGILHVRLSME